MNKQQRNGRFQKGTASKNSKAEEEYNGLDYLEAVGVGLKAVMEQAAEEKYATKSIDKLYVDRQAFNEIIEEHLASLNGEEGVGNEVEDENSNEDSNEDYDYSKKNDFIDKKEGETFTITQHFIYEGTLKAFNEGRAKTSLTMVCPEMQESNHRPLIKESKITMVKNTTPFTVNFKLDGISSTNVQMDENEGTHKKVTYKIPSDAMTPSFISVPIFTHGEGVDFEIDDLQEEFAYTSPAEIKASVQFPAIQEFIGERMASQKDIEKYKAAKEVFAKAEQNFVVADSVLGRFIQKNMGESGSSISLACAEKFPDHILLSQREIDNQIGEMIKTIDSSPIGKMHGMTGTISRHDGQNWDFIPEGIPEVEFDHILNSRQSIAVTVEHHMQAYYGE